MNTLLQIRVKPGARVSRLFQTEDGQWQAQLKSPPVDGKANEELIALVARQMGCRRANVSIKSGTTSRLKLVQIVSAD